MPNYAPGNNGPFPTETPYTTPNATASTPGIVVLGRLAGQALPGNDPVVALAQSAVQPAALTSALQTPVTTVSTSGSTQTLTFPNQGRSVVDVTLTANCAFSLAGGTSGLECEVRLYLRSGAGGFSWALPSGVLWSNGTPPTPDTAAGHITMLTLFTHDAGATVFGNY